MDGILILLALMGSSGSGLPQSTVPLPEFTVAHKSGWDSRGWVVIVSGLILILSDFWSCKSKPNPRLEQFMILGIIY
jgi:hypothetical protein